MARQAAKRKTEGSTQSTKDKGLGVEKTRRMRRIDAGLEPIREDEAYPIDVFQRRTGLGDWALRQAERAGLKVVVIGVQRHIRGHEWLRFLAEREAEKGGSSDTADADADMEAIEA